MFLQSELLLLLYYRKNYEKIMKKISLLLSLAFLLGFNGIAQKNQNRLNKATKLSDLNFKHSSKQLSSAKLNYQKPVIDISKGLKSSKGLIKVLILTTDYAYANTLVNDLSTYPDLQVSVLDTNYFETLSVADLTPYDVVFAYNNITWEGAGGNRFVIGNVLKNYLDAGGKVVENEFLKSFDEWGLAGGYITGNYSAFGITSYDVSQHTSLGTILYPLHPIMRDVSTLTSTCDDLDPTLAAGAIEIADWADGEIAIAVKPNVVSINMLPVDTIGDYGFSGNGIILYHNAIVWLGTPIAHCDITPTQLFAPLNSDSLTVSDIIKARVANNDTIGHYNIPISYVVDGGAVITETITDTIPARSNIIYAFQQPHNFSSFAHKYNVLIYTAYACDTVNTNDTLSATVRNCFDVGVVSIDMNPVTCSGTNPKATLKNMGILPTTFDVTMNITGGYTSTKTVTNLAPYATLQVVFDPWITPVGNHTVEVFTTLAADSIPANDTLTASVNSGDANITVNIQTDNAGHDVTWTIKNTSGTVVASGGPYTSITGGEYISTDVCLYSTECYKFSIYDAVGDGICCDIGNGTYEIKWDGFSFGVISGNYTDSASINNICLPTAIDLGVDSITTPVSACYLSAAEDVKVVLKNFGTGPVSNFHVCYKLNNEAPVTSTIITSTLTPLQTLDYTFTGANAANLGSAGNYTIKAYTVVGSDGNNLNDTISASVSNVSSSNIPYSMGFEPSEDFAGWTIENTNNDLKTWTIKSTGGHSGHYVARYSWSTTVAADDWLITKCLNLQAGKTYHVSYWYKVSFAGNPESFAVKIGNAPTSSAQTIPIANYPHVINTSYVKGGANFTVPSDGVYYIGFHCYSAADEWNLYIDDISITEIAGINEVANTDKISIYPNPAKDVINVFASEKIRRIKVMNAFGQVIISDEVNNSNITVNTTNIANGMYYLQIETNNGLVTKNITICK